MTDVTALLAGIKTRATAAMDYPGHVTVEQSAADVPRLVAAIVAVATTHKPSTVRHTKHNAQGTLISYTVTEDGPCVACYPQVVVQHCEDCEDGPYGECEGVLTTSDSRPWPCPTITAVVAALGGGE